MVIGLFLVALGVIFLLRNLGIISQDVWGIIWPTILIILGLSILFRRKPWWWSFGARMQNRWDKIQDKFQKKFQEKMADRQKEAEEKKEK